MRLARRGGGEEACMVRNKGKLRKRHMSQDDDEAEGKKREKRKYALEVKK